MRETLLLYVDDSGTRHPDKSHPVSGNDDWFGLGGILVREADENAVRNLCAAFRDRWASRLPLDVPLHSHEIRQRKGPFTWLRTVTPDERDQFYAELTTLITSAPLRCTACVIDRPGHRKRYFDTYTKEQRWSFCRTAFSVLLERTAKLAARSGARVRVFVERGDKTTDGWMRRYYDDLRASGPPFSPQTSAMYEPLSADELRHTLYDFKTKNKSSPLMQLADVCLYPICKAGYDRRGRDYQALVGTGRLLDMTLAPEDLGRLGVKYSCFEGVACIPAAPAAAAL